MMREHAMERSITRILRDLSTRGCIIMVSDLEKECCMIEMEWLNMMDYG